MIGLFNEASGLVLGRRTYDIFAAYWPNQPHDDPLAPMMNGFAKYVVSQSLTEPLAWQNSTLITGDVRDGIANAKQAVGGPLLVIGSGELVTWLAANGLVDEYRLAVHPLVLGKGKRLFRESVLTTTGVLLLTYVAVSTDGQPSSSG